MSAAGERAAGFTLFEMLVVLAILGLIGGIVYPALAAALRTQALRGAAADAATVLRSARARAIRSGAVATVSAANWNPRLLPVGIRVSTSPEAGIQFFGDGTSRGGTLTVATADRRLRFAVVPATGQVVVAR